MSRRSGYKTARSEAETKMASRLSAGHRAINGQSLRTLGLRGQAFHFFLVDLDLAFLLECGAKVFYVEVLVLFALLLKECLFRFVPVLFHLFRAGLLNVKNLHDDAVRATLNRAADLTRLQSEGCAGPAGHRPDVRNLRVLVDQVAGLDGGADF